MKKAEAGEHWAKYCSILEREKLIARTMMTVATPTGADPDRAQPSSAQEVIEITKSIQDVTDSNATSSTLRDVRDKTVSVLSALNTAGSAIAGLNPYAALAWGVVQFLVSTAVNDRDIQNLCLDNLPRMAELIICYQTFEDIYAIQEGVDRSRQLFENALENLYTSTLKYQIAVVVATHSRSLRFKSAFRPVSESLPQSLLSDINQCE